MQPNYHPLTNNNNHPTQFKYYTFILRIPPALREWRDSPTFLLGVYHSDCPCKLTLPVPFFAQIVLLSTNSGIIVFHTYLLSCILALHWIFPFLIIILISFSLSNKERKHGELLLTTLGLCLRGRYFLALCITTELLISIS